MNKTLFIALISFYLPIFSMEYYYPPSPRDEKRELKGQLGENFWYPDEISMVRYLTAHGIPLTFQPIFRKIIENDDHVHLKLTIVRTYIKQQGQLAKKLIRQFKEECPEEDITTLYADIDAIQNSYTTQQALKDKKRKERIAAAFLRGKTTHRPSV